MRLEEALNYNYLFPLGLAYLASALKKTGYQVNCLNLNHYSGSVAEAINNFIMKQGRFDFACTGGISTVYGQVKAVVEAFHAGHPDTKLILGGGLISSEPELMFDVLGPAYIVIGEGEETIGELISCVENKGDLSQVAGIGYRDRSGKIIFTRPRPPIADIDSIPWPDFEGFEFGKYLDQMHPSDQFYLDRYDQPRAYPIICSRSCPFNCTFCYHPIGKTYRQRSVNKIMDELTVMLKRYRINLITIYDELFSNDREWLNDFCRNIKVLLKSLPWECKWGCQMRVDKLDDAMLKTMQDSGCYSMSYGFESYSPTVLKSMQKHISPQQIDRAIKLTMDNHLCLQANFIFGDPAETLQTTRETLDYWKANVQAGVMLTFVNPYPGTAIYQKCLERGVIKDKLDFIENRIFGVLNMSETMSDRQFIRLWYEINKAVIKYRVYARKWELEQNRDGTYSISVECPHCKKMVEYKNYLLGSKYYFSVMMYCRKCSRRFFLASGLFKAAFSLLLLVYTLAPGWSYRFYEHIWPKRYELRNIFRKIKGAK